MVEMNYDWHRFWVPENAPLQLEDDAFLPDPGDKFFGPQNPDAAHLLQLQGEPCLILLGESGLGKTRAVQADFARLKAGWAGGPDRGALIDIGSVTSDVGLRSKLLDHAEIRTWRASADGTMHLYLDSLDEAVAANSKAHKVLIETLKEFPVSQGRLRLSMACRTDEFPPFLDKELAALFGTVTRRKLAPLTKSDVRLAAKAHGIDPDQFMRAVSDGNQEAWAARPVTLGMLLEDFRPDEPPKDIRALYERGCQTLIKERADSSRADEPRRLDDLNRRLALAGRIACTTVFSARAVISTAPPAGEPATTTTSEIAGDTEVANGNPFAIGEGDVHEVLRTSLFTASGPRFQWAHKSYAEYMAARHVSASGMPLRNKVALITSGVRVPSALRGVAGWLTSLDDKVFDEILRLDPYTLLLSDLSLASDHNKAAIVAWLLNQAEDKSPVLHEWGFRWNYRKLKHTNLAHQLEPVLERSDQESARHCAIQIIEECGELGLQGKLATLALCPEVPLYSRIAAANSVVDHGDSQTRARLLPLALVDPLGGDEERLQVQALMAVWPECCTWHDLKTCLGSRDYPLTESMGRFVGFDVPRQMKVGDFAEALLWLSTSHHSFFNLSAWAKCADKLMDRAAREEDRLALSAIIDLLYARLTKHFRMFDGSLLDDKSQLWPESMRRMIASGLVARLVPDPYPLDRLVRGPKPLLTKTDLDFAIGQWNSALSGERGPWQTIVGCLIDWNDSCAVTDALERVATHPDLHAHVLQWQTEARNQLAQEREGLDAEKASRETIRAGRQNLIRTRLADLQTNHLQLWSLLYAMSFPLDEEWGAGPQVPIHLSPGWDVLAVTERDLLLLAGKQYIDLARPWVFQGLRKGRPTAASSAGYWIFIELLRAEPAYLERLPDDIWNKWAPAIISVQSDLWGEAAAYNGPELLALTLRKAERNTIRALSAALCAASTNHVLDVLQNASDAIPSGEFHRLFSHVRSGKIHPANYLPVLRLLIGRGYGDAVLFLNESFDRILDAPDSQLTRLGYRAALLLHYKGHAVWPDLFRHLQVRPTFSTHLLNARIDFTDLEPDQLRDFYVWLREQFGTARQFPSFGGPPEHESQGHILTALRNRRDSQAISALENLAADFPDDWYLRRTAWEGRQELLDSQWSPIPVARLRRIVKDSRQLIVRDEQELADAVWEALVDYQASIRDTGSRVMRLWNEPIHTPKPEEPISREIANFLQPRLLARGVSITCEPKFREGQYLDILADTLIASPGGRKLSFIIEVKGCWHHDLSNALETQLAARYLKDSSSRHGVYLVAWFLCDRWDEGLRKPPSGPPNEIPPPRDSRKQKTPKIAPEELREELNAQADAVNRKFNLAIRPFVLDATIEGSAKSARQRKPAARKRQGKQA